MIIRSESMAKLGAALVKAQQAMGKAHKSATNPFFKSKYADLEAVLDTVLDPLNSNGIALVQLTGEEDNKATVTTMLMHESGEFIGQEAGLPLAKFDGHALGSAYTYLRRYGASAAVGLVQSDDDGNAATKGAAKKKAVDTKGAEATLSQAAQAGIEPLREAWGGLSKSEQAAISDTKAEWWRDLKAMAEGV